MFVKGVQNVFLYRLVQFLNQRRQKLDIHRWIAKFELQRKRLQDAWMDLVVPIVNETSPKYAQYLAILDEFCRETRRERPREPVHVVAMLNEILTRDHKRAFPFSDNLLTMIFIIFSQLQEQQRLLLTQHMEMRNIRLEEYDFRSIRSWFPDILVST